MCLKKRLVEGLLPLAAAAPVKNDDGCEAAAPGVLDDTEEEDGGAVVRGSCPGPRSEGSEAAKAGTVEDTVEVIEF